ncbi:acyl carrier protein [Actinokineospora sp. G85]|uniref:acyl carrier protein n=1 Tax=Actinokineospora sp. G85 TaxID=3406626 RepID=UPI003C77FFA5
MTGVDLAETVVAQRIREVLGGILDSADLAAAITDETNLVADLGLNSIQMINFLLALEDAFDVELEFEELSYEQLESFPAIRGFVLAALSGAP